MDHGILEKMPLWLSIPFVLMLLCIAVGPLFFSHWWDKNKNKLLVSIVLGAPVAILFLANQMGHELFHQIIFDYVPFIILLGSLFIITGGIHLEGDIKAKPAVNTLFLAIGGVLASLMGTTGAAMLLIRPVIKTNSERRYTVHTILFFIAIVANAGGLLTPLGDPPLFMMYLRGTPFTWFLGLAKEWAFVLVLLLLIYFIVDSYFYKKEDKADILKDAANFDPIRIKGKVNFIFLLGVILSVAFLNEQFIPVIGESEYFGFIREAAIALCAILSLTITSKKVRYEDNKFTWGPIVEVAFLFLGIFITMVPALIYLKENALSLGLTKPAQFYYASGCLSSFLDNTPTAVSFHNLALGLVSSFGDAKLVAGIPEILLSAICLGSVMFGAMTYIGNGPNFMVKAIAEESGIKMPSFFAYMYKFSLIVLLPVYIIAQLIFL
ncbi:MAG TPA: sodium:proton antiporter [Prolixibacteraceae bacterium]|nr:sodium:proton antiporter [Prolixibacteraceae bacterium]HPS12357.1 sodium:proton antiporter [Prolixibacteraceae bacterium]